MKLQLTILLFLFGGAAWSQETSITLVSGIWPPFTNEMGKTAIATELVQEALKRIEISSSVVIEPFDSVLMDLKENKYNGSPALWKVAERKAYLIYSEPFLQNQMMIVSRKGVEVNNLSLTDLEGKRLGVVTGYAYADSLLSDSNINFVFSENDQRNVEKLFANKIDFLLVDDLVLSYMLKYELNNIMDALVISTRPFGTRDLHFAVSKKLANAAQIIKDFNAQIQAMILDGTFHEILNMQWIVADLNKDGIPDLVLNGAFAGEVSPKDAYALFYDKNSMTKDTSYYINGAYYSSWSEVPERFKSNPRHTVPPENYSPGIRIKF